MSRKELPAWVQVLTIALGATAGIWGLWCTVTALIGGTMPLIGIHVHNGSVINFVLMLFIGAPLLMTITYRVSMLVLLPMVGTAKRSARNLT
jgi:hypothetical protein